MCKKGISVVIVCLVLLFNLNLTCLAEIPVIDVASIAKSAEVLAENVKAVQAAYDQITNQMKMLENMAKNVTNMPQDLANQLQNDVQNNIKALMNLQTDVKGMSVDYHNIQNEWSKTYPDLKDSSGMSPQDYVRQWDQMAQTTSDSIYDAMRSQGLVAQIGDDMGNLQKLLQSSQTAPGILAAAQVGNQIAAQNTQQLMRMQQMMASANSAQLQMYERQLQDEKRKKAEIEKAVNENYDKINDMTRLTPGS